jgi:protein TonB
MSEPCVIFKELPATFPEKDKYQKPSVIGSVVFHVLLIAVVLIIPSLVVDSISRRELLITLVSPIGPPPPPPPLRVQAPIVKPRAVEAREVPPVMPGTLVMPSAIPSEIAKIVEEPIAAPGVIGGVPGGVPGGMVAGVLGGVLANRASEDALLVPPPPVPPPPVPLPPPKAMLASPVRVGGDVREPRVIRIVPPIYPRLARQARIAGVVILEATLTAEGAVEEIRVVSGHPLLVEAAIDAVKQWQYEPTLLNGVPVAVILTARVRFERTPFS